MTYNHEWESYNDLLKEIVYADYFLSKVVAYCRDTWGSIVGQYEDGSPAPEDTDLKFMISYHVRLWLQNRYDVVQHKGSQKDLPPEFSNFVIANSENRWEAYNDMEFYSYQFGEYAQACLTADFSEYLKSKLENEFAIRFVENEHS